MRGLELDKEKLIRMQNKKDRDKMTIETLNMKIETLKMKLDAQSTMMGLMYSQIDMLKKELGLK